MTHIKFYSIPNPLFNLIVAILVLVGLFHAQAQSMLHIDPDQFEEIRLNIDISDEYFNIDMESFLTNLSPDTINLKWKRSISENCPDEWDIFVSDFYISYLPWIDSNVISLDLLPLDSNQYFIIQVYPRSVPGCCDLNVVFSDYYDANLIYDTIHYSIKINDELCLPTSTIDKKLLNMKFDVYPNPVITYFRVGSDIDFDTILIYDFTGKLLKKINKPTKNKIDVAELQNGYYHLQFILGNQIMGQTRIIKLSN